MRQLRGILQSQSSLRRVFIDELIRSNITLVHSGECPESTVTPEEAGSFFLDAVHIAPSAPPTAVNDQEAEDLVRSIIRVELYLTFYLNRSMTCNVLVLVGNAFDLNSFMRPKHRRGPT